MAEFEPAFKHTMEFEDRFLTGIVATEPGGERARFGINEKAHPELPEYFWTGPKDQALATPERIMRGGYWDEIHADGITSQDVANKIYDMAINMGWKQAVKYAQRAVHVAEDGAMGPKTLGQLNALNPLDVLAQLRAISKEHYEKWAEGNPVREDRLRGLLKRAAA